MPAQSILVPVLVASLLLPVAGSALADSADVVDAKARCRRDPQIDENSICRFVVRIRHTDDSWDHYTRHFQLVKPDGEVLVTRFLKHPHEAETFTRLLPGVKVPREIEYLEVRAGDLEHDSGEKFRVEVPHPPPPEESDGEPAAEAN